MKRHPAPPHDPISMEEHLELHHDQPMVVLAEMDAKELRELHAGLHGEGR